MAGIAVALGLVGLLSEGCQSKHDPGPASIEFTRLPPSGEGSPDVLNTIEGRVKGAEPGQRIVLFARSGMWWVQPFGDRPFTAILPDSAWKSSIHPGTAYAALLVDAGYSPPLTTSALPKMGSGVRAVSIAEGTMLERLARKTLHFSGYEWEVRHDIASPGGSRNQFSPANAWVDQKGLLHLRISRKGAEWTSAEVDLPRSLGYGSYRFVVSDTSQLEPAAVLNISTWDASGPDRELDIEISRWGEPTGKNAQYVVQPYYIPANVVRFLTPSGHLAYSFDWEPGRVSFKTVRESGYGGKVGNVVADHVFTSGIPSPGGEAVHMTLYVFNNNRSPLQREVEVIIERFEYLP